MKNAAEIILAQREYFESNTTRSYNFRLQALHRLRDAVVSNEAKICEALNADLHKSYFEAFETEIGLVVDEITYQIKHLKRLMKPRRVRTPLAQFPSKSFVRKEPYGVVLIMSPWNYPFQLTIEPLAGAIAAGNTVILKPSDYSRNTSQVMADILGSVFPPEYITVMLGGREANQDLLKQKFDYIFFTGGVTVGKLVMQSASQFVTPVTLELGGQSPCIVDNTANLAIAAKRIAWGKFLNAGQTCVAPNHLFVHESVKDELLSHLKESIRQYYTDDPLSCGYLPKIINQKHFNRLSVLMDGTEVYCGGRTDAQTNSIEPTIIDHATYDLPVMNEEIFGPLLPVLTYSNFDDMLSLIRSHPRPLALYLFSTNRAAVDKVLTTVPYGGGCVNDVVVQLATSRMPFGGVGNSGMGKYHGADSFDTFSHAKSILHKSSTIDLPIRYMPPSDKKLKQLRKFIGKK
ncbi:MAG: aldehyde dehydrogenase [Christensenella sp.]|uniref:aldehyde dehydrogenase n=1 Tax=Christensenella sp. TaxID=1935934 RepID=UPI002B1E9BAB|nr:aldehyde dehydrogenase [Christensenella sp.]MEA5002652.1 aldehyde dehydrogenase [Christensenella sp.]